ncbi:MAG: hypothetical protein NVSMB59_09150 [Vulcanimicrobiaceae bacterium]
MTDIMTPRGRAIERVRRPGASDRDLAEALDAIVALETQPGMARYIGHWPRERHARNIADADSHYLVVRDDAGAIDGFAIVTAYAATFRWFELSRIAVGRPGDGRGTDVLAGVLDYVYSRANAHRLQLEVYEDNARARRAYARAGFVEEGVLRDAVTREGEWVPLVLLAMLEDEWRASVASRASATVRSA